MVSFKRKAAVRFSVHKLKKTPWQKARKPKRNRSAAKGGLAYVNMGRYGKKIIISPYKPIGSKLSRKKFGKKAMKSRSFMR